MKVLLLIAHGSRLKASNDEVKEICNALRMRIASDYDLVMPAYLELCQPCISKAIDEVIEKGAQQIVVMPYFLNQGRHVTEDVPAEISQKMAQYPQVKIKSLPYFGQSKLIEELLVQIIRQYD